MSAVRQVAGRWPQVLWLTLVWALLWGTGTPLSLVGGVLVAVAVTALFPLPRLHDRLPLRPVALLRLGGYLLVDLVSSTVAVSWVVLRHGRRARAGIVEVPLLTDSDLVIAATANAVSLAPGTFVLQIDRPDQVCFVYVLGMRDASDAVRVRRQVLGLQRRVIAAIGTAAELTAVTDELRSAP